MHGNQKMRGQNLLAGQEDDEDDDPAEGGGDEHDTSNAEDEELSGDALQYAPSGPGCAVSDEGGGERDGSHGFLPCLPVSDWPPGRAPGQA